jgi:hypothetical protein
MYCVFKGEFLTRITHETLHNHRYAAAGVEFETNKGRIFSYQPLGMSTNWKSEQTTLCALPGKEIIGLKIKHGVLIGTEQQNATCSNDIDINDVSNFKNEWYCIGKKTCPKLFGSVWAKVQIFIILRRSQKVVPSSIFLHCLVASNYNWKMAKFLWPSQNI